MLEARTLDRWHRAGLIDEAGRDRIRAWEATQARPMWLWGLAGIGAFAIALGVVALVAANWALIPGRVKIGSHLTLDVAIAAAAFAAWRAGWDRTRELLSLLLFGLVLSGIGLVGQVYQLGGTTWVALTTWIAVCTPFLLLVTRSGLCGLAWCAAVIVAYGFAFPELSAWLSYRETGVLELFWIGVLTLLAAGLLRGMSPGGERQGVCIRGVALTALLAVASLPPVLLSLQDWAGREADIAFQVGLMPSLLATLALVPVFALDRWRRGRWDVSASVLAGLGWAVWFACDAIARTQAGVTGTSGVSGTSIAGALVFMAFWACVAALAVRSGQRAAFGCAFAVIALRVFVLYWEAFGGLLSTAAGLLIGGVLCIAVAALGWRVAQIIRPVAR